MGAFIFGTGPGWNTSEIAKLAKKHGATSVNHTDPDCRCGYGCDPGDCSMSRRHWFEADNKGDRENDKLARTIVAELKKLQEGNRTLEKSIRAETKLIASRTQPPSPDAVKARRGNKKK